jgi:hypothetical protein
MITQVKACDFVPGVIRNKKSFLHDKKGFFIFVTIPVMGAGYTEGARSSEAG